MISVDEALDFILEQIVPCQAEQATILDAYANTTVRRDRPSSQLTTDKPAPEPAPSRLSLGAFSKGDD
mgnify:CR=1 FL=1